MRVLNNYPQNKRVSTKDIAYFELKKRIIEGSLRPGESIVEDTISKELGISRTPLREALQRLEIEALIERQINGRLIVAPISIKEVKEIFNVRSRLEGLAVAEATENAKDKDFLKLSTLISRIKESYSTGNIDDIFYYGGQFHMYIYEMSENVTVSKILHQLNDHIHRYRRLIPETNMNKILKTGDEHEYILSFMLKGDKEGAVLAMTEHILTSLDVAIESIKAYKK